MRDGDILQCPVRTSNGTVLLKAGTCLTESYIERLKMHGIDSAYIEERRNGGYAVLASASGKLKKSERGEDTEELGKRVYNALTKLTESDFIRGRTSVPLMEHRYRKTFRPILFDVASHNTVIDGLTILYRSDPLLYEHAMNVAFYAGVIGLAFGYSSSDLLELTIGALLFDLGMAEMPRDLLTSTRRLSAADRTLLESHARIGFDLLIGMRDIPTRSARCALQHHERFDGSGYPYRLSGQEIDPFAQIVAIADTYDALVSPRHHRKAFARGEAMEFLLGTGNQFFDLELVRCFHKHINIYPVASRVLLSNGQVGVVSQAGEITHRPIVRVVRDTGGKFMKVPYELDLKIRTDITIVSTVANEKGADHSWMA